MTEMVMTVGNCGNAKESFLQHLKSKTATWKADTQKYIQNMEVLLQDDLINMLKGNNTIISYSSNKYALCKLIKGSIPEEHILKYNALIEYGKELGLMVSYAILADKEEAIVEFNVSGEMPNDYPMNRNMVSTKAKIKNIIQPGDLENIEEKEVIS